MQSSIGRQCFELGTLQVDFLIVLWGFFGHASFGEGILVGFFFFCGFLPFVLFCLVCCFLFCFVFSIDYATEVQDMLSLQWCLDGTLYYIAHCNCEAGWVRVDKL